MPLSPITPDHDQRRMSSDRNSGYSLVDSQNSSPTDERAPSRSSSVNSQASLNNIPARNSSIKSSTSIKRVPVRTSSAASRSSSVKSAQSVHDNLSRTASVHSQAPSISRAPSESERRSPSIRSDETAVENQKPARSGSGYRSNPPSRHDSARSGASSMSRQSSREGSSSISRQPSQEISNAYIRPPVLPALNLLSRTDSLISGSPTVAALNIPSRNVSPAPPSAGFTDNPYSRLEHNDSYSSTREYLTSPANEVGEEAFAESALSVSSQHSAYDSIQNTPELKPSTMSDQLDPESLMEEISQWGNDVEPLPVSLLAQSTVSPPSPALQSARIVVSIDDQAQEFQSLPYPEEEVEETSQFEEQQFNFRMPWEDYTGPPSPPRGPAVEGYVPACYEQERNEQLEIDSEVVENLTNELEFSSLADLRQQPLQTETPLISPVAARSNGEANLGLGLLPARPLSSVDGMFPSTGRSEVSEIMVPSRSNSDAASEYSFSSSGRNQSVSSAMGETDTSSLAPASETDLHRAPSDASYSAAYSSSADAYSPALTSESEGERSYASTSSAYLSTSGVYEYSSAVVTSRARSLQGPRPAAQRLSVDTTPHPTRSNTTGSVPLTLDGSLEYQRVMDRGLSRNAAPVDSESAAGPTSQADLASTTDAESTYTPEPPEPLVFQTMDLADRMALLNADLYDDFEEEEPVQEEAPTPIEPPMVVRPSVSSLVGEMLPTPISAVSPDSVVAQDYAVFQEYGQHSDTDLYDDYEEAMGGEDSAGVPDIAPLGFNASMTSFGSVRSNHSQLEEEDQGIITINENGIPYVSTETRQYFVIGTRRIKVPGEKLDECKEPWMLRPLYLWVRTIMAAESNSMAEGTLSDVLTDLFMRHIEGISFAEAEDLGIQALEWFIDRGVMTRANDGGLIVPEAENRGYIGRLAKFRPARLDISAVRRESQRAQPDMNIEYDKNIDNWTAAVPQHVRSTVSVAMEKLQNVYFEMVMSESMFLNNLRALLVDFKDVMLRTLGTGRHIVDDPVQFTTAVVHNTDEVLQLHERYLFFPLRERQRQAHVMSGVGDILVIWIRHGIEPYLRHADGLGPASEMSETERRQNPHYAQFVSDFQSANSGASVSTVMTKLLRYPLLIGRMLKCLIELETEQGIQQSAERRYLERAHGRITQLASVFQSRFVSSQRQYVLRNLRSTIYFSNQSLKVELGLSSRTREMLNNGSVEVDSRRQSMNMILLDNYLLMTRVIVVADRLRYDVVYPPIPIDFLTLVSQDDGQVNATFHRASVATINSSSSANAEEMREFAEAGGEDNKIYPFRIKHLGRHGATYQIFVASDGDRKQWCAAILRAIDKRHESRQMPLSLQVVSDSDFGYRDRHMRGAVAEPYVSSQRSTVRVALDQNGYSAPTSPIAKSANCTALFYEDEINPTNKESRLIRPEDYLKKDPYVLVGCKTGIFMRYGFSGTWYCVLRVDHVRQMKVLPEFGLVIFLADKKLFAYSLDAFFAHDTVQNRAQIAQQSQLQRLMNARSMGDNDGLFLQEICEMRSFDWFNVGILNKRTVIVAHQKDTESDLRVFEPIAGKCQEFRGQYDTGEILEDPYQRRIRIMNLRNSEFYGTMPVRVGQDMVREIEPIYLNSVCLNVTITKGMIVLHTKKGFQALVYPSMIIAALPQLTESDPIKTHELSAQTPLGFFRVSEHFYLLCYSHMCLSCDSQGFLSRQVIIRFTGTARSVAVMPPYVLGLCDDFVEIRLIQTGDLVSLVTGTDVQLIGPQSYSSDSANIAYSNPCGLTGEHVLVRMAHPVERGRQVILRFVRNTEAV
ncbi:CNH domain-containing protein [Myxozyma melibiosi]|uniref:CNH domain-containing protein n=1 Tax=Myxozyma melibiosi TaxID=54550 RepID=A0ABR1F0I0_9ASCO